MSDKTSVGVVVGRFQLMEITPDLEALFERLLKIHLKVMVVLGDNPAPSNHNPMGWRLRETMFRSAFGDRVEVVRLPDASDDHFWSESLDNLLAQIYPGKDVVVYGTQSGFVGHYFGKYKTAVLPKIEKEDESLAIDSPAFRAGMIYAHKRRFPTVYPTVDVAVLKDQGRLVLLGRKPNEEKYRFPGGFVDPADTNYEAAALRELKEECGSIEVDHLKYIGSCQVDDWRYRESVDSIITHLFVCRYLGGHPTPLDDIEALAWFRTGELAVDSFVPEHKPLFSMLKSHLE